MNSFAEAKKFYMDLREKLEERAGGVCELCAAKEGLSTFKVEPYTDDAIEHAILVCENCNAQLVDKEKVNANHWRCLNDSMWSAVPAVQVVAWRMLNQLKGEGWPMDLLDMLYLDEETLSWAQQGENDSEETIVHKDSNGAILTAGDSVVLIKDLNVKGANFTAKRGAAVRNISLVFDNAEQIEGRVNGQHIVILTQFVKKTS